MDDFKTRKPLFLFYNKNPGLLGAMSSKLLLPEGVGVLNRGETGTFSK
jgi:hypothetical protein